jgi:hypothetical protein
VSVAGLEPGRRYYYRVFSSTPWGVRAVSPVLTFDAPAYGVADSRLAQWQTGTVSAGATLAAAGDGELRLTDSGGRWAFVSRLLDAEQMVGWRQVVWDATVLPGSTVRVQVRTGSTAPADDSWSPWVDVPTSGAAPALRDSRYLRYRVRVEGGIVPLAVLRAIGVTSTGRPPEHPTEGGG